MLRMRRTKPTVAPIVKIEPRQIDWIDAHSNITPSINAKMVIASTMNAMMLMISSAASRARDE